MNEQLKKAIEERDKYLKEHPEMNEYQKEIDDILNKTQDDQRILALSIMIASKSLELSKELGLLKELVIDHIEQSK